MCFPVSCSGRYSTNTGESGGSEEENIPINQQPKRGTPGGTTVELQLSLGGSDNLLGTISTGGSLLASFLNDPHTQKALESCDKKCTPWCKEHCPGWCSWFWDCCCNCCLKEREEPVDLSQELKDFIGEMQKKHGPVCVGFALGDLGDDLIRTQGSDGSTDQETKNQFEARCKDYQTELGKRYGCSISQELFETTKDGGLSPGPNSIIVKRVQESMEAKGDPTGLPTFWVLHDNVNENDEDLQGAAGGIQHKTAIRLDFGRLGRLLSRAWGHKVDGKYEGPLGEKGQTVVRILQKTLLSMLQKTPELFSIEGSGCCLSHSLYLQLVCTCMLGAGYIPLKKGKPGELPFDPKDPNNPWAEVLDALWGTFTEIDRTVDHVDHGTGPEDEDDEGWDPQDQSMLLQLSTKVKNCVLG